MTYIEERLTTIANALETHSELLAERRNIANASVSIGKAAEELRKLAKQHSEQIADMSELCLTVEEANELKVEGFIKGYKEAWLQLFGTEAPKESTKWHSNSFRKELNNG